MSYDEVPLGEVLIRLAGGLAYLRLRERSLRVMVAAPSDVDAAGIHAAVAGALPEAETDDREVPVRFWWWHLSARELARMLPSPRWERSPAITSRPLDSNYRR